MKQRTSVRIRFLFWLDDMKADESELISYIEELKRERRFVTSIKQGLRLLRDLRAGRTDVLRELFPNLDLTDRPHTRDDTSELAALVEEFRSLMLNGSTAPRQFELPSFDDSQPVKVTAVIDPEKQKELDEAAKARSVVNTLASIADF